MWEVYEFLARGGPIMVPIAVGSVTALAILLERLWSLRRVQVNPPAFWRQLQRLVERNNFDAARAFCESSNFPMARIVETCLRYRHLPRPEIKQALEDVGRREVGQMNRLIEAVGIIAAVSPLLGLLGTVTGMIQTFRQVVSASAQGAIDPSRLANGIWEALITTATGLSVAILAYLAYRFLAGRLNRLTEEMEAEALTLLDQVTGVAEQDGAPTNTSRIKKDTSKQAGKEGAPSADEARDRKTTEELAS
jgi:biopolymer transport protein ExbB